MRYNIPEVNDLKIDSIIQIELFENFGSGYPLDKLSRNFNGIIYLVAPRDRIFINGKCYDLEPGDVIFFRKGEKYRVELPDNYLKCYVIDFSGENDGDYMVVRDCEELLPMFERAEQLWRRHREDEYFRLDCAALTYRILAELCRRRDKLGQPLRKTEKLKPVIERIHLEYSSPELRVSELARMIGVSERSLSKTFTEVYGCSPKRYLTELRIKRAKELLAANSSREYPISEVAKQVGFSDVYHFSNFFRRESGMSPSEYRRVSQSRIRNG